VRFAVVVLLAACQRPGGGPSPQVPIEPAAAPAAPPALIATVDGAAPASAPTGEPVAITYVPVKVGDTRELGLKMHEVYDTSIDDGDKHMKRHQDSEHTYRVRQEVTALAAGHVKTVRATVLEAHEKIVMDGDPHEMDLLDGGYVVELGEHHQVSAKSSAGGDIASRELEELQLVFGIDSGDEPSLVRIVTAHPLRLHESVAMTDGEKQIYAEGPATKDPVALTLVDVSGGFATYQIDMTRTDSEGGMTSTQHLRERSRVRIATGQLVERIVVMNKTEDSSGMKQDERAKAELTFSIVPH